MANKDNSVVWGVFCILLVFGGVLWTMAQAVNAPPYHVWMLVTAGILIIAGVLMSTIAWRGEKWIKV